MEQPKKKKKHLGDVAELAGVGIATVDRVLNERGCVSPKTAKKVLEAARTLRIGRILPSPYTKMLRIKFVILSAPSPLFFRLKLAIEAQLRKTAKLLVIERVWIDSDDHAGLLETFTKGGIDAIIAYIPETSAAIEAISSATSSGIPVITLCSDLPTTPRLAYVGVDHYSAGHAAGYLMSQMASRKTFVAVSTDLSLRSEAARVSGFRDAVTQVVGEEPLLDVIDGDELIERLQKNSIGGVYFAGWKGDQLSNLEPLSQNPPIVVAHDLGEYERGLMASNVIHLAIDQSPEEQVARSISVVLDRFDMSEFVHSADPVPFTIHTYHNI